MIKKKNNIIDRNDELFKENNDQYFYDSLVNNKVVDVKHNSEDSARDNARDKSKRSIIFKQGIKSKSLDFFDRPDLSSVSSSSQPAAPRRQLSRVRSLASIPENSIQVGWFNSLFLNAMNASVNII